eukprot:scaffold1901_cov236-Pinguiococcus_pyrenoidosus.AAC.3
MIRTETCSKPITAEGRLEEFAKDLKTIARWRFPIGRRFQARAMVDIKVSNNSPIVMIRQVAFGASGGSAAVLLVDNGITVSSNDFPLQCSPSHGRFPVLCLSSCATAQFRVRALFSGASG